MASPPCPKLNLEAVDHPFLNLETLKWYFHRLILQALGYTKEPPHQIRQHPRGSRCFVSYNLPDKARPSLMRCSYLLLAHDQHAWVLHAQMPDQPIHTGIQVELARRYAQLKPVNVPYYSLCNGKEWITFHVDQPEPILYFSLANLDQHWERLFNLLSPDSFTPILDSAPNKPEVISNPHE